MEAPDQQQMTPQISENATVEQVDLHFVGLVDTEEETVSAEVFRELGESLDVHALGKHDITEIFSPPRFTKRQLIWKHAEATVKDGILRTRHTSRIWKRS